MIVRQGRIPWQILTDIRAAAVECATHGWPIQPGTYRLTGSPRWHGRPGAIGMLPVHEDWPADRIDPDLALTLWTVHPYSILIACGTAFDAVEVPAAFGPDITELLRAADCLPPMITTQSDTWILLTSTVDPPRRVHRCRHPHPHDWFADHAAVGSRCPPRPPLADPPAIAPMGDPGLPPSPARDRRSHDPDPRAMIAASLEVLT